MFLQYNTSLYKNNSLILVNEDAIFRVPFHRAGEYNSLNMAPDPLQSIGHHRDVLTR